MVKTSYRAAFVAALRTFPLEILLTVAGFGFIIWTIFIGPAHAESTVGPSTIPLKPWVELLQPYITAVLDAAVTAIVGYVALYIKSKWKLDIDTSMRERAERAFTNAAGLLVATAGERLSGQTIDVGHPGMARSIEYVQQRIPEVIEHLGLTPEMVATKIVAKIPQLPAQNLPSAQGLDLDPDAFLRMRANIDRSLKGLTPSV